MPQHRLELSAESSGVITVKRFDGPAYTGRSTASKFKVDRNYKAGAAAIGVSQRDLDLYVHNFREHGVSEVFLSGSTPEAYRVRLLSDSTVTTFADFAQALTCATPQHVIEWDDSETTAVLDIDFHRASVPAFRDLETAVLMIDPAPPYWFESLHGGAHLIYRRYANRPACDHAAIAALYMLRHFPECSAEVLTRTRGTDKLKQRTPTDSTRALGTLYHDNRSNPEQWNEFLHRRNLSVGERYPHTCCPCAPGNRAEGNSPPVAVYDDHIYCYVCAADGRCYGSKTAGYFPAATFLDDSVSSLFRSCVDNRTHWEHAKYVVCPAVRGNENLAKTVYGAALRAVHGVDDILSRHVFTAGVDLVRYEGHWGNTDGTPFHFRSAYPATIAALPRALVADSDGTVRENREIVERLMQPASLEKYGYPAVVIIWGIQLTALLPPPHDKIYTLLPTTKLRSERMRSHRPRYVPPAGRMTEEAAWNEIEKVFPTINRAAVKLLIAAKGCAEGGAGLPPMLFFTGPTGSSKTATAKIAAAICGDEAKTIAYTPNIERLRAGVLDAKKNGTFALFDEYLKGAARDGRADPTSAMDVLLNFTEDSVSHVLYVGPVAMGSLPVCIWCDTFIPKEVQEHAQLGRRLTAVYFPDKKQWEHPMRDAGINVPDNLRAKGNSHLRAAADAILSYVIDEFFSSEPPIFRDIAEKLGFAQLEACDLTTEKHTAIRKLFDLVCKAPALTGADKARWADRGWKLIDLDRESELSEAWRVLADLKDRTQSRSIREEDLKSVLSLSRPAVLDTRSHGTKLVIRFSDLSYSKFNGELYAMELETATPDICGLGNAELPKPPDGGEQAVHPASVNATNVSLLSGLRDVFAMGCIEPRPGEYTEPNGE